MEKTRYGKLKQVMIRIYIPPALEEKMERLRAVAFPGVHRSKSAFVRHILSEFTREHMHMVYTKLPDEYLPDARFKRDQKSQRVVKEIRGATKV